MAKARKTKKGNCDEVYTKKATSSTNPFARGGATAKYRKMNPFEIHVNREKFHILGRTCKHDKGIPGASRAKAIRKRHGTLGQEFKDRHKTNQFNDKRIGRNYAGTEIPEKMLDARFVADKMSQLKQNKMSRFNLNDDEVLTHRGQTLVEIEQFNDDRSDDDEEEDALDPNFTEVAHFGGDEMQPQNRKAAIEEIILETKRRKAEVARDKEEVSNLTEKLDKDYKDILKLLSKSSQDEPKNKPMQDDYDKIVRELIFEPRGVVTDKLKTAEELMNKEKERLAELENERLLRMRADDVDAEKVQKYSHRSADDLDDGYFANGEAEQDDDTLAYNLDGQLNGAVREEKINERTNNEIGAIESGDEDRSDSGEEKEEEVDKESEDSDDDIDLADLKAAATDTDEDSELENEVIVQRSNSVAEKSKRSEVKYTEGAASCSESELPFVIEMPANYTAFTKLIKAHTPETQATLLERMVKCHDPKLDVANREKVVQIFQFLLRYINELFVDASTEDITKHFSILAGITPLLYDLMHLNAERMSQALLRDIKLKYAEFNSNPKSYPTLDTFVLLKLVSNLYSTSDFRHPIVTPCVIFAQHILSVARVRTRQDIAMGLFLVTILLEYTQRSHRFLPAAWYYLVGILYLAIPKRLVEVLKVLPPFKSTGPTSKLLAIAHMTAEIATVEELMCSEDLVTTTLTPTFKVRALNTALKLIIDFISSGFGENVGANYMAQPVLGMLERLPMDFYPHYVCERYAKAKQMLQELKARTLVKLVPQAKKPKALRLLEPRFEPVYDDKRRPKMTKEREERAKLLHKVRRETKGAMREIRRDTEYLQKIRLQQQIQSDMERKQKVKRIFQEASVQQGELNELARIKKKKKF